MRKENIFLNATMLVEQLIKKELIYLEDFDNIIDEEEEVKEVMEYYFVSEWLYRQLKKEKEPVTEYLNQYIWGRCTTGQDNALDEVIQEIAIIYTSI